MQIVVKQPDTEVELVLEAKPAKQQERKGWEIIFPEKTSIFVYLENGKWLTTDPKKCHEHEFIRQIGISIKPVASRSLIQGEDRG